MKKFLLKSIGAVGLLLALSGCEIPVMIAAGANDGKVTGMFEITFPAVLLINFEDGTEELLRGTLAGNISGSAKFDLEGPTYGRCTGGSTKAGFTTMSCENGVNLSFNVGESKPKMSGVNVVSGTAIGHNYVSAMGWGKLATEDAVRAAISDFKDAALLVENPQHF